MCSYLLLSLVYRRDPVILVIAYQMGCKTSGVITKEEFFRGMQKIGYDLLELFYLGIRTALGYVAAELRRWLPYVAS